MAVFNIALGDTYQKKRPLRAVRTSTFCPLRTAPRTLGSKGSDAFSLIDDNIC